MYFDLQRASMLKRISARILDVILVTILATGFGLLVSAFTGYDAEAEQLDVFYNAYEQEYGIRLDLDNETYETMTETELAPYEAAYEAMSQDSELQLVYSRVVNLSLLIISLGFLMSYAVVDFAVPLIFKNGQTIGKKVFGLGVMQTDQTRIRTLSLAVRTFLGRYTIETMIPVLLCIMIYFGFIGISGTVTIGLLLLLQLILLFKSQTNAVIHDLLSQTVVIDFKSQMIFENAQALQECKDKLSNTETKEERRGL